MKTAMILSALVLFTACETRTPDAEVTTDSTTVVTDSAVTTTVPLDTVVTQ